jgi:hypothetical protein
MLKGKLMNSKKSLSIIAVLILLTGSLAACSSSVKAGQVRGALVTEAGQPPSSEYQIILCKIGNDPEQCATTEYQIPTTQGAFVLEGVPAGQYAVFILSSAGQGGFLQNDAGTMLVFDLLEGKGIDIGSVTIK